MPSMDWEICERTGHEEWRIYLLRAKSESGKERIQGQKQDKEPETKYAKDLAQEKKTR